MADVTLTRQLIARGYSHNELSRRTRAGELDRVRRGAYAIAPVTELDAAERHRRMLSATVAQLHADAVVSHGSAAVLHGLPFWPELIDRVHVTRSRSNGARRRSLVQVHAAPLAAADVVVLNGVAVTSLARTVLDLARVGRFDRAVAIGDRALAAGLDPEELALALARAAHWRGARQARRVVAFLDGRSESVGESLSRVRCAEVGLPAPDLQFRVCNQDGVLVGRSDFCWEEQRTLGEFDGKVKYGRLLKPGQTVGDVIYAEKLREDALRDLGWQIVRWIWADLSRPWIIRERVERAFARSAR